MSDEVDRRQGEVSDYGGEPKRIDDVVGALARTERSLMDHVTSSFERHHDEDHASLNEQMERIKREHETFRDEIETNGRKLDRVVTAIYGEKEYDVDGDTHREGGFLDDLDSIKSSVGGLDESVRALRNRSENGGVPARLKLTTTQKIAVTAIAVPVVIQMILWIADFIATSQMPPG
jgi:hypothetical protein